MKQEKKQPGRLKMLAGYYKPYKGLFFADLFFAFLGAAVTLVIPLMVRYIMNSISEMPAAEAKTMILKIGVGMLVLILVQLGSRYFITYYGHMMGAYIEHDMRNEIFSHYQKLSFAFYDNQKVGHLLSRITSDLFDISKVQSGAEQIISERLDACTLARQALAEQEAQNSGLVLKVTLPERELPIWADGRKMSRVLENLIGNCVKYAMKGTRVFVSLDERDGKAVFEVKNTANYEMDFAADEITERFVRGDAARSTEGSGLGLAIAKSYTEACGGMFEVEVDGDQFKVRISFPVYGL